MDDRSHEWKFELFVAGDSPQSRMAISDLKSIVETYGSDQACITVTDLFEHPDAATEKDILAIPTLIRESPPPTLRIIGDLSNKERVWSVLTG